MRIYGGACSRAIASLYRGARLPIVSGGKRDGDLVEIESVVGKEVDALVIDEADQGDRHREQPRGQTRHVEDHSA